MSPSRRFAGKDLDAVIAKNNIDFPTVQGNPEVSSLINQRAYERVLGYVREAREQGFRVIQPDFYAGESPNLEDRQLPLAIIVNPDQRLAVHQEEVFGPVLSVYTYRDLDEAIAIVNAKAKPLGLYAFGKDKRALNRVVTETSSGGVTINDLSPHALSTSSGWPGSRVPDVVGAPARCGTMAWVGLFASAGLTVRVSGRCPETESRVRAALPSNNPYPVTPTEAPAVSSATE